MIFNVVVGVVASQKWTIEWQDIGARCSRIHRYPKQPLCNWVKTFLKFHFETFHLILLEVFELQKYLFIINQNVKNQKNLDPIVQPSRVDTTIRLFTGKLWVRWHRKQSDGKLDEYIPKMSYTICCEIDRVGGIIDRTDAFLGCHL